MPLRLTPTFREQLAAQLTAGESRRPLAGMWLCSGSPLVAEIAAGSGLDWLLIDMEHSPVSLGSVLAQLQAIAAGFMTEYTGSMITREGVGQELAAGFPIGKRFRSERVVRVCDANPVHLGHHARADGRWRLYVFAGPAAPSADGSALRRWADWMLTAPDSPVAVHTPHGADLDALFDIKAIYQQGHHDMEVTDAPEIFRSRSGPFRLADYERVYATDRRDPAFFDPVDIFATRGISRDGAVVVVRPDQYVAGVFPLTDTAGLAEFFRGHLLPAGARTATAAP